MKYDIFINSSLFYLGSDRKEHRMTIHRDLIKQFDNLEEAKKYFSTMQTEIKVFGKTPKGNAIKMFNPKLSTGRGFFEHNIDIRPIDFDKIRNMLIAIN